MNRACPRCGYHDGIDGAKLRRLRKDKGFTLREVSAALGFSFTYLSDIERGSRPAHSQLHALAEFFGVSPSELTADWVDAA